MADQAAKAHYMAYFHTVHVDVPKTALIIEATPAAAEAALKNAFPVKTDPKTGAPITTDAIQHNNQPIHIQAVRPDLETGRRRIMTEDDFESLLASSKVFDPDTSRTK